MTIDALEGVDQLGSEEPASDAATSALDVLLGSARLELLSSVVAVSGR